MNNLVCGLTPQQIQDLKAKHHVLFEAIVKDGDNEFKAIFKEPDMAVLSAVNALSKTDELKGVLVLFDNCVLACDEAIRKRDILKIEVTKSISGRMTALSSSVKNL